MKLVLAAAAVVAMLEVPAFAQGMIDPTRPPPGWMPGETKATPSKPKEAEDTGDVPVQILLVGKTRRYALVRGALTGDKKSELKLIEVKRNDIVVQSENGRETLNLFPDVKKTPPKKPAGMGHKE